MWEGKNVHNLARFRTTFDFNREYLWNGSRYQKSETQVINYNPSHVAGKNDKRWATNKKNLYTRMLTHQKSNLSEDHISAPRAWDFYMCQRLLTHTNQRRGRFWTFFALPNFRGRDTQNVYTNYHACLAARHVEKFREVSPKVIGAHTLNSKRTFSMFIVTNCWGNSVPGGVCASKPWSFSTACKNLSKCLSDFRYLHPFLR